METEYYKTGIEQLHYPVGEHITVNLPKIEGMIKAFKKIGEFKEAKINLICRGSSGAIIAALFAMKLPNLTKIIHIKKEGENSHNSSINLMKGGKNIIVDDFISSGATLNSIYKSLVAEGDGESVTIDAVVVTGGCHTLNFKPRHFVSSY